MSETDPTARRGDARVLMLCVDAMSLAFARAHLDRLPVLRALLATGALRSLESPGAHMSGCVWPTFATGTGPGEHGHYYPFQWDATSMRFRRTSAGGWADALAFEPFWHGLARAGIDATILDAAFVVHDAAAPCRQITNWSYQSSAAASASDPALLREIRRRFGHRPIGMEVPVAKTRRQTRRIRDDLVAALRRKADAILWLMDRDAWRFFLAGFYELHRAGHNLLVVDGDFGSSSDPDALPMVYEALDRELGRILETAADARTTAIVFSLHGMGPNHAQDHFLQTIMARLNEKYLQETGARRNGSQRPNLVTRLRKTVPARVQYVLARALGETIQDRVVNDGLIRGLAWAHTPAFRASSGGEGFVRLSIEGRERRGYFDPGSDELARYKRWLRERLLEIRVVGRDEPLITRVYDVDDLYPGPMRKFLPDLVLAWGPAAPAERIRSPAIGEVTERLGTGRGGNHSGESFMVAVGPGATHPALSGVRATEDLRGYAESLLGYDSRTSPPENVWNPAKRSSRGV